MYIYIYIYTYKGTQTYTHMYISRRNFLSDRYCARARRFEGLFRRRDMAILPGQFCETNHLEVREEWIQREKERTRE